MAELLFDTDVLIHVARGNVAAKEYFDTAQRELDAAISSVTQMELLIGCERPRDFRVVGRVLDTMSIVKLSPAISDLAVRLISRYAAGHGLGLADALIAATALAERATLATFNRRHHSFIRGLQLAELPPAP